MNFPGAWPGFPRPTPVRPIFSAGWPAKSLFLIIPGRERAGPGESKPGGIRSDRCRRELLAIVEKGRATKAVSEQ
jgi:hypothetical protein